MHSDARSWEDDLELVTSEIIVRFEALGAARDHAVTHGRQVIRLAANAVRALHRGEHHEANQLLDRARALLDDVTGIAMPYPSVYWAGYVQDAMKEYAEAAITAAILQERSLPSPAELAVADAPYLNALAEAASELRRDTLDALRAGQTARAERLLDAMDTIYASLLTVDFPDAVTGGLRRTTDQLRPVLERTRGDVTVAVRQDRLEQALVRVERIGRGDSIE